ncbi:transposon Ty3-I Gag-Pol polyprotein [Trichonephila inaurata madagascariensis]|uniref:Transposon Ty3-I Gag-Pol polyprotein n=1 Tax=Trichonephila inaurata madagascariensis TaxID=2747483 RepID=A0A8X7CI87_9ARAC|nr:transposon Ty3-I Gag-Pol polyprotein [Trichonephila inaurata madagascariensis]
MRKKRVVPIRYERLLNVTPISTQRPRQENKPTEQGTGRRTSDNLPICFHCGRPGHVTRYCRDRQRVFSSARQRRQLDQYERWVSDSVSDYGRDPESNYQLIEVILRILDSIRNAAIQDLHLVAHLLGPVRKTKTGDQTKVTSEETKLNCDQWGRATDDIIDCGSGELQIGEKSLQMNEVNSGLYAVNDVVILGNSIRKISALAKDHQTLEKVIVTGMKNFEWSKELKVPSTIVTLQNGKIDICIANSSSQPQIIPFTERDFFCN